VQIFATPTLAEADRVSKAASARLGVPGSIEFEERLYKVRLGAFATEEEAQALRERAVREGYPGAFRVRTTGNASGDE
jgi:cell division septation protein DedD